MELDVPTTFTATFDLRTTYQISGEIEPGVVIPLPGGGRLIGRWFKASVAPGRGIGGVPKLRIDRYLTVLGAEFAPEGHLRREQGMYHYFLSGENIPVWVRSIAQRIENTECPRIATPAPLTF